MITAPPLHFVVPVWGEPYLRTYLDYCLPTQLAPGNIPALRPGSSYTIMTTGGDLGQLEAAPAYRALQRVIPVRVGLLSSVMSSKYQLKSACYRRALQDAAPSGAAVVALNADIVLADGFVASAVELLSAGKRVIEVLGPRGMLEPIGRALAALRAADGAISIGSAELAALWLAHQHPLLAMHQVEGPAGAPFHPSHLYWPVGDEGVIVRAFHLYPIVIWPPAGCAVEFRTTIDDDLVANLGLQGCQRHIVQDSRELFCCELSAPDHHVPAAAARGDLGRYRAFYAAYGAANLPNLRHEISIAGVRDRGAQWEARREESQRFIEGLS